MITHSSSGRSPFFTRGAGRFFIVAGAALLLAVPALRAETVPQDQQAIQNQLPVNVTLLTAKPAALATAVADAIALVSGTNGRPLVTGSGNPNGLTINGLTTAALQPIVAASNKTRADRNTTAGVIDAAVINQLAGKNGGTADTQFNGDVASLTDATVDVSSPSTLSASGKSSTIRSAVATIADLGTTNLGSNKYPALTSVATALSGDSAVTVLNLEFGLTGVTGTKHLNVLASAPDAAASFAQGLTGANLAPANLAIILKGVSTNTRIDNFFSYGAATASGSNQVAIASTLIKAYPKAIPQITQGVAASILSGSNNEAGRVSFAGKIAVAPNASKQTVNIIAGLAFVDPYYADQFTSAVFAAVTGTGGTLTTTKLFAPVAAKAAVKLGNVLGADGNELAHIARVYAQQINAGKLLLSSAGTYAIDLIGGAVKGSVKASPTDIGYGGKLVVSTRTTVTLGVVKDLAAIADILVNSALTSPFVANTTPALIATIAGDVVNFIKNSKIDTSSNYTAAYIAGTIANEVKAIASNTNAPVIIQALLKALKAKTNSTVFAQVTLAVNNNSSSFPYLTVGSPDIAVPETPVTNF